MSTGAEIDPSGWAAFWIWIGRAADLVAFVSIGLATYVALNVKGIKNRIFRHVRLQAIAQSISRTATNISKYMESLEDFKTEIDSELAKCESDLRNLSLRLTRPDRKNIIRATKKIKAYRDGPNRWLFWKKPETPDAAVRKIYFDLRVIVTDLGHLQKDQQVGLGHAD